MRRGIEAFFRWAKFFSVVPLGIARSGWMLKLDRAADSRCLCVVEKLWWREEDEKRNGSGESLPDDSAAMTNRRTL